jgi:hypothetical protein
VRLPARSLKRPDVLLAWPWTWFALAAIVPTVVGLWASRATTVNRAMEPLKWAEGISAWPGFLIRLGTLFLAVGFLLHFWKSVRTNRAAMEEACGFDELSGEDERDRGLRTARAEWTWYRRRGRGRSRLARSLVWFALFCVISTLWTVVIDPPVRSDLRQDWFRGMNVAVWYAVGLLVHFFNFYVFDACCLERKFVDRLSADGPRRWPEQAMARMRERRGIEGPAAEEALLIGLVAARTRVVGAGVLYPAVLLSILLISVQSVFETWAGWTWSVIATFALSGVLVLASASSLRWAAELARRRALVRLRAMRPGEPPTKKAERVVESKTDGRAAVATGGAT